MNWVILDIPWFYPAIFSAISWGLYYPIAELLLNRVSGPFLLIGTQITSSIVISVLFLPALKNDLVNIEGATKKEIAFFFLLAGIGLIGNCSSFMAIASRNATLTAFLEISYPLFVALFGFLLFRNVQLNASTMIGGGFIMTGVMVIALNS